MIYTSQDELELRQMQYQRLRYRYAMVLNNNYALPGNRPDRPGLLGPLIRPTTWRPSADVLETTNGISVLIDLAGVDYEKLRVLIYEDAVILEGERRLPRVPMAEIYHQAEIPQGKFRLEIALPMPIDMEDVDATYDRGLLHLTFTKTEALSP